MLTLPPAPQSGALAVLFTATIANAAENYSLTKEDRYVGCIFSWVVPLLHQGKSKSGASAYAHIRCAALGKSIKGNELEGLEDYVQSIIEGLPVRQ